MSDLTISVTQLNTYIKNIFDAEEMLIGIKVVGEITNLKPSSRAIYFDLKDENASLSCVVFDETIIDGFQFGDKVTVKGKLNYYTKGGKLSFVVNKIEKFGLGDLYQQYLKLKESLEKEGLFDEKHKKQLPNYVRRVGVVTSRTGAVIRDIIRVKHSKNHWSDVVLFPVKVQGQRFFPSARFGCSILHRSVLHNQSHLQEVIGNQGNSGRCDIQKLSNV